ncbi:hypothetical protein [Rhizobium sp. 21-4511-3d]
MIEGRSVKDDEIHARLVEAIEKPERAHLWVPADAIEFTPHVLPLVYGDGRALFTIATINQRPAYWVIRGCSTWGCDMDGGDATGPDFGEMTDDFLTDLEEHFGSGRCGYSGESLFFPKGERHCDCEECQDDYVASWPEVDGCGGCSWSRCDWPDGFDVEPNPLSRWGGNLLKLPPSPIKSRMGAGDHD